MSPKKKQWVGRIWLPGGERVWVGRFPTKRERDQAVARKRMELERTGSLGVRVERMTCQEYYDRYLRDYRTRNKDSSVDTLETQMRPFLRQFGGRELRSISRVEAQDWAATAKGSYRPSVVAMFNRAVSDDVLERNPFRGLGHRSRGRSDEAPPTVEEFERLKEACSVLGDYGPMIRALLVFAAFTGMRPGELYELKWQDIDFDANRITVSRRLYRGRVDVPKNGRSKLIVLTPPAREVLVGHRRVSEYVFTNKRGGRLSASGISGYWGKVRARAGLDFDFYLATKHFCVHYLWTELGLSDRAIAAQMGWGVAGVQKLLRVYGHGEIGALSEIDEAFARAAKSNVMALRAVREENG